MIENYAVLVLVCGRDLKLVVENCAFVVLVFVVIFAVVIVIAIVLDFLFGWGPWCLNRARA